MKMSIKPARIYHSMLLDMAKKAKTDRERTIFYTTPGEDGVKSMTSTTSASIKTAISTGLSVALTKALTTGAF